MSLKRIRLGSWLALGLCLVLPFSRGCEGEPIYAFKFAFSKEFLLFGLPFAYPLIVLWMGGPARRWWEVSDGTERRLRMLWAYLGHATIVLAASLQWMLFLRSEPLAAREGLFVLFLLGLFVFVLMDGQAMRAPQPSTLNSERLLRTVAAHLSVYSSGTLFYLCDIAGWRSLLIGGWVAMLAGFSACVAAMAEYGVDRETGAPQGPAQDTDGR